MGCMNFAKGMALGLVVGSAISMAATSSSCKSTHKRKNVISKALKTMGDIVENIGDSISF